MKVLRGRSWLRGALGVLVAFLAIQLMPYGYARTNPPVVQEPAWDSPNTRLLAKQACFDCHSNESEWPIYARVAPASWLVQRDIAEGRAVLNFSEWQRRQEEAEEAAEKVVEGEMPLPAYRLMHGHARLSEAQRTELARGLERTIGSDRREEPARSHEERKH